MGIQGYTGVHGGTWGYIGGTQGYTGDECRVTGVQGGSGCHRSAGWEQVSQMVRARYASHVLQHAQGSGKVTIPHPMPCITL